MQPPERTDIIHFGLCLPEWEADRSFTSHLFHVARNLRAKDLRLVADLQVFLEYDSDLDDDDWVTTASLTGRAPGATLRLL